MLGAGPLQVPAIRAGRALGVRVVVTDGDPAAPGLVEADRAAVIDIRDAEACLDLARHEGVAGVIHPCSEVAMHTLGLINDRLGLAGPGVEGAWRATNKERMRRAFEAAGVPSPRSVAVVDVAAGLVALEVQGRPGIVKPSRSSGSRGVTRLGPDAPVDERARALLRALEESRDGTAMVEDFVEGPEVSVELLVWGGRAEVLAVTDKLTSGAPHFVEVGHTQPSALPAPDLARVTEVAAAGTLALGVDRCAAHAELRLSPTGPVMIEVGARLGGDYISTHLVPLSTGFDMVAAAVALALGDEPRLAPTHARQGSAIRYLTPTPGIVREIRGLDRARALPGVAEVVLWVREGSVVRALESSLDRAGHVIATGPIAQEAAGNAERARGAVRIRVEPLASAV